MKQIKKHPKLFMLCLVIILFVCFLIAINLGSIQVTPIELFKGLFIEYNENVASIYKIRFPRVIVVIMVGGALALSGLLFQVVLKNHLADPGIIGISSGANLVSLIVGLALPQLYYVKPLLSFLGGVGAFLIIYMLSWKTGLKTTRIILIGVAINYTISAFISLIESSSASIASSAMGTIALYTWNDVKILMIYLLPIIVITMFTSKACQLLGLEDHTLMSLGINVNIYRFALSFLAVLLCSISVAVAGVISFIGLIVPHFACLFVGHEHHYLLPVSFLLGAITLLVADTIGRVVIAPYEISSAIIMAIIGGPLLIILLKRSMSIHES